MLNSPENSPSRFVWEWKGQRFSLPFSKDDILTLARAVNEEGYPKEGVAWALIQRAAWLHSHGVSISLGRLVQQYAQPINPAWFPTGSKHLAEMDRLARLGDSAGQAAETARAYARIAKANKPWDELAPDTRALIDKLLNGKSFSPVKGAIHYWASRAKDFTGNQARRPEMVLLDRGYGFGPGRNVFFAENGSSNFGGVVVENGAKSSPNDNMLLVTNSNGKGVLRVIVGGIAGYIAWKWLS